jgi:hypothetical protein
VASPERCCSEQNQTSANQHEFRALKVLPPSTTSQSWFFTIIATKMGPNIPCGSGHLPHAPSASSPPSRFPARPTRREPNTAPHRASNVTTHTTPAPADCLLRLLDEDIGYGTRGTDIIVIGRRSSSHDRRSGSSAQRMTPRPVISFRDVRLQRDAITFDERQRSSMGSHKFFRAVQGATETCAS